MSLSDAQLALTHPEVDVAEPNVIRHLHSVSFRLAVTIPIQGLKLRDLQVLGKGRILKTIISAVEDVPVNVGGALLGWAELDNVDGRMAVRLTRLS
jgi:flagellar motor switch protein FliN/FliY